MARWSGDPQPISGAACGPAWVSRWQKGLEEMGVANAPRQDRRILEITREQVRRFGVSRVTLVSVAEQASMTHANIYRYFASKQALFDALTADWLREVESRLSAVVNSPDPADDKLERLLLELMRVHRRHLSSEPELYALLIDAYAENRPVARQHRARIGQLIDHILEDGILAQMFAMSSKERALGLVFDLCYRFLHPQAVGMDRTIPDKAVESRHATAARAVVLALKARLG